MSCVPEKNVLEYDDSTPIREGQQRRLRSFCGTTLVATTIVVWTSCSVCHEPRWVRRGHLGDNICKRCNKERQRQRGKVRFEERVNQNGWTLKGHYVDSNTPVSLICTFGHEFEQIPYNTTGGGGCKFCSGNAVHADKIREICDKVQCTLKTWHVRSSEEKSVWQCSICGVEFEQNWSILCRPYATGCPRCFGYNNLGEEMVRSWIEATMNKRCPPWTIPGTRYRIDILANGLPIEIDGPHHRQEVRYNRDGFENVARRDAIKDELCRKHLGTAPYRIVWNGDWGFLEAQVLRLLRELGHDIQSLPIVKPTSKLIRERECLAEFDYKLNAPIYRGQSIPESVTCPNGHKYSVTLNNFKSGKRCKQCYNIHRQTYYVDYDDSRPWNVGEIRTKPVRQGKRDHYIKMICVSCKNERIKQYEWNSNGNAICTSCANAST